MNIDVVFEILLHLPVRSLLRFIGVHKSWYYIINSPHFRKLYTVRRNNKDEEVYLEFTFRIDYGSFMKEVSINLLDNGKSSLILQDFLPHMDLSVVSGAVKGLVCLSSPFSMSKIAICNPFLGQFKILPFYSYPSTDSDRHLFCNPIDRFVGLGFEEDYKVVQFMRCLLCSEHPLLNASLYSARTNSWSELDIDQDLVIEKPIKSVCKNGSFAHWEGLRKGRTEKWGKKIILSFDMKNEVFRTITISLTGDELLENSFEFLAILAKGECSFVIIVSDNITMLKVYESSGEGSELIWNNVNNVKLDSFWRCSIQSGDIPIWRNDDYVVLRGCRSREVILYDYRAQKFIGRVKNPKNLVHGIIEYEGSLISP